MNRRAFVRTIAAGFLAAPHAAEVDHELELGRPCHGEIKTATALGLTIPPSLLQRADQVVE